MFPAPLRWFHDSCLEYPIDRVVFKNGLAGWASSTMRLQSILGRLIHVMDACALNR